MVIISVVPHWSVPFLHPSWGDLIYLHHLLDALLHAFLAVSFFFDASQYFCFYKFISAQSYVSYRNQSVVWPCKTYD